MGFLLPENVAGGKEGKGVGGVAAVSGDVDPQ